MGNIYTDRAGRETFIDERGQFIVRQHVERLDVYDLADELEDVLAQLRTGIVPGYDPLQHLEQLVARTWEASKLTTDQAHTLRDQRFNEDRG